MKVRKKIDILEAFRFGIDGMPGWFMEMVANHSIHLYGNGPYDQNPTLRASICTSKDRGLWIDAKCGDIIVKDMGGVVYPVEPAVFGLMFEVVER